MRNVSSSGRSELPDRELPDRKLPDRETPGPQNGATSAPAAAMGGMPEAVVDRLPFAIVVTDPNHDDNPIVYVNTAFEEITGYARSAVVGRNCRFLQGSLPDQEARALLREAIREEREISVDIRNFRADGTEFLNRLLVAPVQDDEGRLAYFVGVQKSLEEDAVGDANRRTEMALREVQHRVKNHLAMIISMIRLEARRMQLQSSLTTLSRRVETLQLLYEEMVSPSRDGDRHDRIALGAYLGRITNAIAYLDGRSGIRVNAAFQKTSVPANAAVRIGLTFSEVLTNAFQHAFAGRAEGSVSVSMQRLSDGLLRVVVEDDGVGIPDDKHWPNDESLGGQIVSNLSRGLDAEVRVDRRDGSGTRVTIDIPDEGLEAAT